MKITDLEKNYEDLYHVCLLDWNKTMNEVKHIKKKWWNKMKDKGLKVKLAFTDDNIMAGMIEYMPVEYSFARGKDLYVVNCIWVHGYDKGPGNLQGKGIGKALLKAAEEDVKSMGRKGLAAWGLTGDDWLPDSWFEKKGYEKIYEKGGIYFVWKAFAPDAVPPEWIENNFKQEQVPGKVKVTAFISGQCPSANVNYYRAKKAASEFGDRVIFEEIDLGELENIKKYGLGSGIYINGENIIDISLPPPSYDKIKGGIEENLPKSDKKE